MHPETLYFVNCGNQKCNRYVSILQMCSMFIISTCVYSCFCLFVSYHSLYRILAIPTLYKLNSPHMVFFCIYFSLFHLPLRYLESFNYGGNQGFEPVVLKKKRSPSNRSFVGWFRLEATEDLNLINMGFVPRQFQKRNCRMGATNPPGKCRTKLGVK